MSSSRNIAIIVGTLGTGGAERQLGYILRALKLLQFSTSVHSLTKGEYYEHEVVDAGAELLHIPQKSRSGRFIGIPIQVRKTMPIAVMSMHFFTNLYAYTAAKFCGVPSIGSLRSDCISEVQKLGLFGKPSLKLPNVVAANSEAAIRSAIDYGVDEKRLIFLPNIVDQSIFKPTRQIQKTRSVRIIFVGRLEKQKRVDRFIRLISRLSTATEIECRIYGSGTLEMDAKKLAKSLNLREPVLRFMGTAPDMQPVYVDSDVLVLTSDIEGTPNVILEAQAAGVPVIATSVGGIPDIITHNETGILVASDNEEALYLETLALLTDHRRRKSIANEAILQIKRNNSKAVLLEHLTALLKKIDIV